MESTVVVYETWREFTTAAIDGECPLADNRRASRQKGRDSFVKVTWDEAVTLATDGWQTEVPRTAGIAARVSQSILANRDDKGFEVVPDVTGDDLDIGRYCTGEPEMLREVVLTSQVRRGRVVPLMVSGAASCGIPIETIRQRGAAVVALAGVLRRAGYVLDVWLNQAVNAGGQRHVTLVHVQDAAQPIDMGRLMYAVGHDSMLRRMIFSVEEQESDDVRRRFGFQSGGGYGMPGEAILDDFKKVPRINLKSAIILPTVTYRDDWSEEASQAWIAAAVEAITTGEPVPSPSARK